MPKCSCGACEFRMGVWWFWLKRTLGGVDFIRWIEPICPRCFDGLGEGGETTQPSFVLAGEDVGLVSTGGCICTIEYFAKHAKPGRYYLLPAPKEVPE